MPVETLMGAVVCVASSATESSTSDERRDGTWPADGADDVEGMSGVEDHEGSGETLAGARCAVSSASRAGEIDPSSRRTT
jgi:hypothetical protein